jgi:hypothetical protein
VRGIETFTVFIVSLVGAEILAPLFVIVFHFFIILFDWPLRP